MELNFTDIPLDDRKLALDAFLASVGDEIKAKGIENVLSWEVTYTAMVPDDEITVYHRAQGAAIPVTFSLAHALTNAIRNYLGEAADTELTKQQLIEIAETGRLGSLKAWLTQTAMNHYFGEQGGAKGI